MAESSVSNFKKDNDVACQSFVEKFGSSYSNAVLTNADLRGRFNNNEGDTNEFNVGCLILHDVLDTTRNVTVGGL